MPEIINILEVIELKKTLEEKFGVKLHIHDACGGQFFSLEEISPASKEYIIDYFSKKNYRVIFTTKEEKEFYLEGTRQC